MKPSEVQKTFIKFGMASVDVRATVDAVFEVNEAAPDKLLDKLIDLQYAINTLQNIVTELVEAESYFPPPQSTPLKNPAQRVSGAVMKAMEGVKDEYTKY